MAAIDTGMRFRLDRARSRLYDGAGRRFDPLARGWLLHDAVADATDAGADSAQNRIEGVDALGAVQWVQRESGHPLRVPVGVIGPRDASTEQLVAAVAVGELLGDCGIPLVCGGRQGVMQAVCEGAARVGGVSIGILPDADPSLANPYVSVALATGIGEARNALVARAALCLIAIGDSFGTLSEVALGRQFGKLVVGLCGAARVDGVRHVATPRDAVTAAALRVLGVQE